MAFLEGVFPRVIAHRGLALAHAENTVGAFQAAIDVGADILETDVHLSKDGAVIIAHDPDLGRVAQRPGLVSDLTQRELADIDLGWVRAFLPWMQSCGLFPIENSISISRPPAQSAPLPRL